MADRHVPVSTDPTFNGANYMNSIAGHIGKLYSAVALIPTSITHTGNQYTINVDPVIGAGLDVTAGMSFYITPDAANTDAVQVRAQVSTGPATFGTYKPCRKANGDEFASGEFDPTFCYFCVFRAGEYRVLSANAADSGTQLGISLQIFTAGGTFTLDPLLDPDAQIMVELWGGGGGGGTGGGGLGGGGGGGGGAYNMAIFRPADLTSTVAITIGAAGSVSGAGGQSTFGTYLSATGGGAGGAGGAGTAGGAGGAGAGRGNSLAVSAAGGAAASASGAGGAGVQNGWGGGSGGGGTGSGVPGSGGGSEWGGGGGAARNGSGTTGTGGSSTHGGAGGAGGVAGQLKGGAGGAGAVGGAGLCVIRIIG